MSTSDVREGEGQGEHRTEQADARPLTTTGSRTGPTDLDKRSWFYVLRKTVHEFTEDQCTDLAAALTYYAVLSIFPAMLALISVLGVLGQAPKAVTTVEDTLKPLLSEQTLDDRHPCAGAGGQFPRCRSGAGPRCRWSRSGRPPGTSVRSAGR